MYPVDPALDLVKELCQADALTNFEHVCREIGFLRKGEDISATLAFSQWCQGGAESWNTWALFRISNEHGLVDERGLLAKAYTGFGLGVDPVQRVESWNRRAALLREAGVSTVELFGIRDGLLIQRYVKWDARALLQMVDGPTKIQHEILEQVKTIGSIMDKLNMTPIKILSDLRWDGDRVTLVDFGEDLGDIPGQSTSPSYCRDLIDLELRSILPHTEVE